MNKIVYTYLVHVLPAACTVVCTQVPEFGLADSSSEFGVICKHFCCIFFAVFLMFCRCL